MAERRAGFTLIEALAAVAVIAVMLSALGSAMALNRTAARATREHAALMLAARSLIADLPPRAALRPGTTRGRFDVYDWTLTAAPDPQGPLTQGWLALRLALTVTAPGGRAVALETVRLARAVP